MLRLTRRFGPALSLLLALALSPFAGTVPAHADTGSQLGLAGFINLVGDTSEAFNTGFVTAASGSTSVDLSALNMSQRSKAQIGFINVAENGFLPVFPFFNFPKRLAD